MKKAIILLLSLCYVAVYAQNDTLTNKSVIDMLKLGFSQSVILTKVETSITNFDTSIEALKELKENGVPDTIIVSIMNGSAKEKTNTGEEKTGIYVKEGNEMIKILPTVFSGTKTNTLASAFTYGIASSKIKSTLNKATSANKVLSSKPEFYFYFSPPTNDSFSTGAANWWFASASSPNEFALVKLTVKKNKRELQTGQVNIYAGSNIGVDEDQAIKFDIKQTSDYTFKVTPEIPLEPGEYCFFYQGVIPQGGFTNQSVFDFSIPTAYGVVPKFQVGSIVWTLKNNKPYYFEVKKVEIKNNGVYYTGVNNADRRFIYEESDCYASKKDLMDNTTKTRHE